MEPRATHKRKAGSFVLGLGGFAPLAHTMLTILVYVQWRYKFSSVHSVLCYCRQLVVIWQTLYQLTTGW